MRVTLDANILVYAMHGEDPRHLRASEIVGRALVNDCVQTLQSFAECFNALVRKRYLEPEAARSRVASVQAQVAVVAARASDLDEAMRKAPRHKLQFWDAMLMATARRAGARLLISEDMQSGQDFDGLVLVDPFDSANDRLIDLALPLPEA